MNYPLISEYIEAIKSAEDNFATHINLRPVLGEDGNPVMTSGNFAVVFKMKDEQSGMFYAVKCFLKDQPNRDESYKMIADELDFASSTYLVHFKYLEKELFVDTNNSDDKEFPVLVMDWVDGVSLDQYIRKNIDDQYALQMLAYQFSKLAMWLIPQPFAHGDIKPDNIMVREDGSLVLIDYDGMYVPAMKGQKARELGSPDFRHPLRTEDDFNEHIDDFSLVSILLSLRAIANDSSLLEKYGATDRLLFSEKDYFNISSCQLLKKLYPSEENEINILISLFNIALIKGDISNVLLRIMALSKPNGIINLDEINTKCSLKIEDFNGYDVDKYGAVYSHNHKILLRIPANVKVYNVKEGTEIVANGAFDHFDVVADSESVDIFEADLEKIFLPSSIKYITDSAFGEDGQKIKEIRVPSSYDYLKSLLGHFSDKVVLGNPYTCNLTNSDSFYDIAGGEYSKDGNSLLSLYWLSPDIQTYFIKDGVKTIKFGAAQLAEGIHTLVVPEGLKTIEDAAFNNSSLSEIRLPRSIRTIGSAFNGCANLLKIDIPEGVDAIADYTFSGCINMQAVNIPSTLKSIGYCSFFGCKSLHSISIPNSIESIGMYAFKNCSSLSIYIYSSTYKRLKDSLNYNNISIYFKDEEANGGKWIPKSIRHFWEEELNAVVRADVVASTYGLSVRFLLKSGVAKYIPLSNESNLTIRDSINMKEAKLLTLKRSGYEYIYRIVT